MPEHRPTGAGAALPPPPSPQERQPINLQLYFWIAVGVLGLAAVVAFAIHKQWKKYAGFGKQWDTYTELYSQKIPPSRGGFGGKWPQSKLVLIDITSGIEKATISPIFFDVDKDVRAKDADEVGCIGFIKWDSQKVGEYTDGFGGYQSTGTLEIINLESREVVLYKTFAGEEPPEYKENWGPTLAKKPNEEIATFLSRHVKWKTAEEIAEWTAKNKGKPREEWADTDNYEEMPTASRPKRSASDQRYLERELERQRKENDERKAAREAAAAEKARKAEEERLAKEAQLAEEEKAREAEEARVAAEKKAARERKNAVYERQLKVRRNVLNPLMLSFNFSELATEAKTVADDEEFPELKDTMEAFAKRANSYKNLHDASAKILQTHSYKGSLRDKGGLPLADKAFSTNSNGGLVMSIGQGNAQMAWDRLHSESYVTLLEFCAAKMDTRRKSAAEELIESMKEDFKRAQR